MHASLLFADTVDATLSPPAIVRGLKPSPETRVSDRDGWVLSKKGAIKQAVDQLTTVTEVWPVGCCFDSEKEPVVTADKRGCYRVN